MKISKKEKISCFLQVLRYFLKKDKSISLQIKKENKEKNTSEKEEEINYHYIYIIIKRKQWTKRVKKLRWRSYCRGGGIWRLCWANTTHQPLRSGLIWAPRWCWHIYLCLTLWSSETSVGHVVVLDDPSLLHIKNWDLVDVEGRIYWTKRLRRC